MSKFSRRIPRSAITNLKDPWKRLAWAILYRATADLYSKNVTNQTSAMCYLCSQRAGVLMDLLDVDQDKLLIHHMSAVWAAAT
jgi:hypothetical protein